MQVDHVNQPARVFMKTHNRVELQCKVIHWKRGSKLHLKNDLSCNSCFANKRLLLKSSSRSTASYTYYYATASWPNNVIHGGTFMIVTFIDCFNLSSRRMKLRVVFIDWNPAFFEQRSIVIDLWGNIREFSAVDSQSILMNVEDLYS